MSSENNHINYSAGDIELYLAGKLSPMQMHAMEKAALDDPFLAEAMEGYAGMEAGGWNDQLVALRDEIAGKGTVAKVIPLHKSKNNWKKAIAAILILGAGSALTFVLTKDKTTERQNPQIAQNIPVIKATDQVDTVTATQPQPAVTASLNPTASASSEEIKVIQAHDAVVPVIPAKPGAGEYYTPEAGKAETRLSPQKNPVVVATDDKTIAAAPQAINSNTPPVSDVTKYPEEVNEAKRKAFLKQAAAETETPGRQQAGLASVKKEAFNNFFTAQVVGADNSPLPFTNISVRKDNFGTYADAKGIVRLVSTDSILNVEVRSVGYVPKTFTLRNNQAPAKLILQEDQVADKDFTVIRSGKASTQRSRRATLSTDSAVNVEPADGWENYNTYVANNLEIPDDLVKKELHGEVELTFDVKSNGTISNIRVNKSLGAGYDEAAKRLIQEGPQWKVKKGKKTSATVKVQF